VEEFSSGDRDEEEKKPFSVKKTLGYKHGFKLDEMRDETPQFARLAYHDGPGNL
jgi:hypothetical protein